LVVNSQHDPELHELHEEKKELEKKAEKLYRDAKNNWASFATVHLETSPIYGLILRSTKENDERDLRANNKDVKVLKIMKVFHYIYLYFIIIFKILF
jgi:hypothetical protein